MERPLQIAYLIAAHNTPRHLPRLVEALATAEATFFVHFDRKSPVVDLSSIEGARVQLARERVAVYWGDFSQVQASLVMLRQALEQAPLCERFVLLSGADHPLMPAAEIEQFFAMRRRTEFISLVKVPDARVAKPLALFTQYWVRPQRSPLLDLGRKVLTRTGVLPLRRDYRKALGAMQPYAGSSWWALTRKAAQHVVSFVDAHPRFVRYFEHLACPDESFFHTILGNSPHADCVARSLTWADWGNGGVSPATLDAARVRQLIEPRSRQALEAPDAFGAGPLLFARKFPDDSEALLRLLPGREARQAATVSG